MSAWRKLDDLKRKVADSPPAVTDDEIQDILKHADVKRVMSGDVTISVPNDVAARVGRAVDVIVVFGWQVILSRRLADGNVYWNMSAVLWPKGRSSTTHDWDKLGKIARRLGAPKDPIRISDDPNAPVHWGWIEPETTITS
jgi:hypothetical protein